MTGQKFLESFLAPIQPARVLSLVQSGFAADFVLELSLDSLNGLRNRPASLGARHQADEEFFRVLALLREIQDAGAVGLRVARPENAQAATDLFFRRDRISPDVLAKIAEVRKLLGLTPGDHAFRLVQSPLPGGPGELGIATRSLAQILRALALGVDIPPKHLQRRLAPTIPESSSEAPLLRVHSGSAEPDDAFVAVSYEGEWFWVANDDWRSKRALSRSCSCSPWRTREAPNCPCSRSRTMSRCPLSLVGRFVSSCHAAGGRLRWLAVPLALLLGTSVPVAQEQAHPLKPPDRSSPRATLKTFLDSGDAVAAFPAGVLPSPSRARFHRLLSLGEILQQCLDLSEVPPAARLKTGRAAAVALYEILGRIPLPPLDEIPDASQVKQSAGKEPTRWMIPNTEIALVRAESGPRTGEFLFGAETVARSDEFYERVRGLP